MHPDFPVFSGTTPAMTLRWGRVHEFTGPARLACVVALLAQAGYRSLWICGRPGIIEQLNMEGMSRMGMRPPDILVRTRRPLDALWASEEALRSSGLVVVSDLPTALDLTTSRRLQLAAEAGPSLGLVLVPDASRTSAAETRWQCTPQAPSPEQCSAQFSAPLSHLPENVLSTGWRWALIKNKKGTTGVWDVFPHDIDHTRSSARDQNTALSAGTPDRESDLPARADSPAATSHESGANESGPNGSLPDGSFSGSLSPDSLLPEAPDPDQDQDQSQCHPKSGAASEGTPGRLHLVAYPTHRPSAAP